MKWIKISEQPAKGITKIFKVISKEGDHFLGTVKWYSAWRCYSFFPEANTIFEKDCLQDITDFIKNLMEERKKIKESSTEMKHIKLFEENNENAIPFSDLIAGKDKEALLEEAKKAFWQVILSAYKKTDITEGNLDPKISEQFDEICGKTLDSWVYGNDSF